MKKIIALLLAALLVIPFAGCSLDLDEEKTITKDGEKEAKKDTEKETLTIEEQVCFEANGVKVTAKSIEEDFIWGTGIKLLVENNSDTEYSVRATTVVINNYMMSDFFSCSVAAGKKANDTLYLSSSELKAAGIENIGQIEIYFYLYDSNEYKTVYKADCVTIKTSLYDKMDTEPNDVGQELYNENGIRIVGKYVDEDTFWGSSVLLYIENNSDKNIGMSCESLSVNGFMITEFFSASVYAGKRVIDDIILLSSSLEENDITSIDEIAVKFHIYDSDTYQTIVDTEEITFQAK